MNDNKRLYFAEMLGTFFLLFAGTGAMVVNDMTGGALSHIGVSITWGLVVMTVIYAIGDFSGAHINPAVTLGFWAARRFPGERVLPYIISQCLGAVAASLVVSLLFMENTDLGQTLPSGSMIQSFVFEIILTFFLMFVILCVATGSREKGIMAGSAIGAVVGMEAMFGGPVSGASMNPARSLGPALVSLNLPDLWIYLTAPFVGSLIAVAAFKIVRINN